MMNEPEFLSAPKVDELVSVAKLTAQEFVELAKSYAITCPEMRVAAGEDLQRIKGYAKSIDDERKGITGPLDLAKKRVMDLYRAPAEFLELAEVTLKRACIAWDSEQERGRRALQAEAARKADAERARLTEQAKQQAAAGNADTAHAIAAAAQMVVAVPVVNDAPKVAGESTREIWRCEVDDLLALARAVGDGSASAELLLPNMPSLNAMARAQKATLRLPGVRPVVEKVLATKAAA